MDVAKIEQLVDLLEQSAAEELTVALGDISIRIKRRAGSHYAQSEEEEAGQLSDTGEPEAPKEPPLRDIRAGMVGIFHEVDGLKQGVRVDARQVVGLIESMRLMNEITSGVSGTIESVMVVEGSPVEFGQVLFLVREGE